MESGAHLLETLLRSDTSWAAPYLPNAVGNILVQLGKPSFGQPFAHNLSFSCVARLKLASILVVPFLDRINVL